MFNYFQKFLVITVLLSMPAMYAMKRNGSLYGDEDQILLKISNLIKDVRENFSHEEWKKIRSDLLQLDANLINSTISLEDHFGKIVNTIFIRAIEYRNYKFVNCILEDKTLEVNLNDNSEGKTPLYAMLSPAHPNETFDKIMEKFDINTFENLLKHGANSNIKSFGCLTPLTFAVDGGWDKLTELLIKYGADVNQTVALTSTVTLTSDNYALLIEPIIKLSYIIEKNPHNEHGDTKKKYYAIISLLCGAGASLDKYIDKSGNNAFYLAVRNKLPKDCIETLMIGTSSDVYTKEEDEKLRKTVKGALLLFNRLRNPDNDMTIRFNCLPEIQRRILSYFARDYCVGFNKRLCEEVFGSDSRNPYFLGDRVKYVKKVLQMSNTSDGTALSYLNVLPDFKYKNYKEQLRPLLDGSILDRDWENFCQFSNVPKDNLVYRMSIKPH